MHMIICQTHIQANTKMNNIDYKIDNISTVFLIAAYYNKVGCKNRHILGIIDTISSGRFSYPYQM